MDGGESERLRNERQGRVVVFSAVDGVGNRRAIEGLPAGAGLKGERAIDAKLSDACRLALPGLSVPAIAESDCDLVATGMEQLGNVISCVENALVIVCEAGVGNMIADALAVDAECLIADAGDIGARVTRRALERESVVLRMRSPKIQWPRQSVPRRKAVSKCATGQGVEGSSSWFQS